MKRIIAFTTTLCLLLTLFGAFGLSASAATGWTSGWGVTSGEVAVKGDSVTLKGPMGGEIANYAKANVVGSQFDIEVTLKLDQATNGGEYFLLYTGVHRYYLTFRLDGIFYETRDQGYLTYEYDIGYDTHTYRLVGDSSGTADLYADGYFLTSIKTPTSGGTSAMIFYANGATRGNSVMTVTDVTVNPFTGRGGSDGEQEEQKLSMREELETIGWASEVLPAEDVFFGFDKREDYDNWVIRNTWSFEDGIAKQNSTQEVAANYNLQMLSLYGAFGMTKGQDLVAKAKFKVNQFDEKMYINVSWPGYACRSLIFPDVIEIEHQGATIPSEPVELSSGGNRGDGKWHEWMVKTSQGGTKMQLFMDGEPITGVIDAYKYNNWEYNGQIYFATMANASYGWDVEFDWASVELIDNDITLKTPMKGAKYLEGENIEFSASVPEGMEEEIPSVDYYIHGKKVATGMAPDYKATINGLASGTYEVTAKYGDKHQFPGRDFTVEEGIKGEIQVSQDSDGNLFANLEFFDKMPQIAKVEYRLDGKVMQESSTPPYYNLTVTGLSKTAHTVEAVCYDKNGIIVAEMEKQVIPDISGEAVSKNYANDITYTITGESGSAEVVYSNGRHMLQMKHTPNDVTYLTDEGEETIACGSGDFRIVTEGPVAEGYYNGQLVCSFYLPKTNAVERKISSNILRVENFEVSIPAERGNYFVAENITDKGAVYNLGMATPAHVLDFVAGKGDEVHLVLNDGFYRTDLTLKNGKFYGWTSKEISSEPFVEELADAVDSEGDVYYRVETSTGMSRLYADGRWIATFRNIQTAGESTLAVDVLGGDGLSYLAVSDLNDIYYYEDDFMGFGNFDSEDYWRPQNDMSMEVDMEMARMNLNARNKTNAIAEINVNLGEFTLGADVKVKKNTKGFWIYYNRPTTNDYSKVGYNYETGQYEIVDKMGSRNTTVTAPGELPREQTVHLDLKVWEDLEHKYVTLYVDGQPVITQNNSPWERGRIGFMINDGAANVQNFSLRGDSKPMLGVNHLIAPISYTDIVQVEDGHLFVNPGNIYLTKDAGLTWSKEILSSSAASATHDQLARMPSGELISLRRANTGKDGGKNIWNFQVWISGDDGANWENYGTLDPKGTHGMNSTGGRIKVGRSGRVYAMMALDATENPWNHATTYYSEDNGRSWIQTTPILAEEIDATIVEHIVLEIDEDTLHCYTRTDQGTIIMIESNDLGKTWDTKNVMKTPFLSPECCMNADLDPVEDGVIWLTWSYDNDNLHGQGQYPRTNQSIARSKDYGKTWEFYGKPFENNSVTAASATTNLNFDISDEYVVIHSPSYDSVTGGGDKGRVIFIPKDKQVASKRFEKVRMEYPTQADLTKPLTYSDTERVLGIHQATGSALLHGKRVLDAVDGNKLNLEIAAAFLGATVTTGDTGVTLTYAGVEVQLPAEAVSQKDGKQYVDIAALAKEFGLYVIEEKDTLILSPWENMSSSQKEAVRYGLDFFTDKV